MSVTIISQSLRKQMNELSSLLQKRIEAEANKFTSVIKIHVKNMISTNLLITIESPL